MPLYEYEYRDHAGERRRLELRFRMGEAPDVVPVRIARPSGFNPVWGDHTPPPPDTVEARRVFTAPGLAPDGRYSFNDGRG